MPGYLGLIRYALQLQPICLLLEKPDRTLVYSLAISYCHRIEIHSVCEHYYTRGIVCSGVGKGGGWGLAGRLICDRSDQ